MIQLFPFFFFYDGQSRFDHSVNVTNTVLSVFVTVSTRE